VPAPARAEVAVMAEGRELILVLERNQLLAPGYTETHYTADGQPVTVTPNHTDHCHYHGHVQGYQSSWVVLSTCSGMRGLIVVSSNDTYYLHPVGTPESGHHLIHRAEHLHIPGGTCAHGDDFGSTIGDITQFFQLVDHRVKRDAWRTMKYMELFIVADHTLFRNQNLNLGLTKQRIVEIANYVDKFYRLLNIKVALIGLEVWTERDQCTVTSDANTTLWAFLQWKKALRARKKHDNAQLLTAIPTPDHPSPSSDGVMEALVVLVPWWAFRRQNPSSPIDPLHDHSEHPIGAAATMAHEIGHNFGMSHDSQGCCVEATPEQGGCVMAAATGHPFPRVFSSCSKRQLESYFQKGGGMCLFNLPDTKDLVMGRKCGNGFLEDGEDCDCGEVELKVAGTICREAAGSCDLPEYCTGASPYCPANVYLLDGSSCAYGEAYCNNGMCMTHHQQCVQLWGPGAWPAPAACFQDVNMAGNTYGNCGKDSQGRYVKCDKRDAMCGKIQCQSSAKKPQGTNTVSIDTTIRFKGREVKCRGTYTAKDDEEDLSDPGLVMTGTKCGDGMVCKDRRCQNASLFELEKCVSQCHGHGLKGRKNVTPADEDCLDCGFVRNSAFGRKATGGHSKAAFTLRDISTSSHTNKATRAAFPPKTCARQPGFQPVNIVHPFHPPPHSIPPRPRDPKPARPPPPAGKSPMVPTKTVVSQAKLPPPKKPLPSSPVRTPVVGPKHQPPRRPLPRCPLLAKELPPAHGQTLLVTVPPTTFKAFGTSAMSHSTRPSKPMPPQRPVPAIKVQSTSFPLKK
ncbi:hypothetical protein ASZ78_000877, partial [Callipepla squamata]